MIFLTKLTGVETHQSAFLLSASEQGTGYSTALKVNCRGTHALIINSQNNHLSFLINSYCSDNL